MASDLHYKPKFYSYFKDSHDCKVRLMLHGNPSSNKQQNLPPKTYLGKINKIPLVPLKSPVEIKSETAPPLKGSGELVPVMIPKKPPVDVKSGVPPPVRRRNDDIIPFKTITKVHVATSTLPVDGKPAMPPTDKGTNGVVPFVDKKVPMVSYKSPVHVKPGVPPPVKGSGEMIPFFVASNPTVEVKPGASVPLKGDMVPYVMASSSVDGKSGIPTSVTDVWVHKGSVGTTISTVSPVGSSKSIFVPVHVINSQARKSLPQMQLVTSQVQNPRPQVQLLNSQVEKHPPQLQGTQGQKHPSQLQLLNTRVQKPYSQVQLLAAKAKVKNPNPQAQLLTSQAQVSVPQKYIVATSSQPFLGPTQVLTTSHSQLIAAPPVVSSINGNVTTVLRTVASPRIVATSTQQVGSGLNPLPKIITGRLKPVQIIMHDVIDRTPTNIPLVDLKDEELRDSEDKFPNTFQCAECNLHFSNKKELERHEDNHLGEVNYICDQCGKEFSRKRSLEDHLKVHASEKKFECDVCHKRFDYRDNLIFHMRIHGEVKNISIKCPICQKRFGNKSMRDNHLKRHSMEERNQHKIVNNETTRASSPEKKETNFDCDVCDKSFPDKVNLENHKVVHIKFDRGPKLEVKKRAATVEATTTSTLECRSCLTVFNSEQSLRTHAATCGKTLTDTIVCAFCKRHYGIFKQSKDDGSQGMKFICEPCCTFLAQKSQVSGFTPRLENRFICNKCDKCFSNEVQLREHLRSHMPGKPGKPVRCDLCSKNFESLSALQIHRAARHTKKGLLVSQTSYKIGFVTNVHNSKTGEIPTRSPLGVASSVRVFRGRRRKKRKRIERSKARNRLERLKYEIRNKGKMLEGPTESQAPHKRARYDFGEVVDKGSSTEDADESISEADEGKANSYEDEDEEYDSDLALGVPYVEDDDDDEDDDDFIETDLNVPPSDYDDEEEDDLFDKEAMKDLEVTIKQEPIDNDENKTKVMENCTVFNAVPSKGKVSATALVIPDRVIKVEKPDDYEELDVQIKQEKETLEEMVIKEENVTIKEENLFTQEENDLVSLQFPIKEEKLDEGELMMEEEFEFTPFGGPVKEEPLGL